VKVKNIHDCPDTGCGPQADPELNKAKNRTDEPAASDVVSHTVDFMRTSLAQPKIWPAGSDRTSLRGAGQEGTPVVMKGYLWQVKKELTGESCNCKLKTLADTDLHLVIVARPNDPEATSVTVEMTPRVRAGGHPEFTFDNVKPNKGKYVRVTGWLMLDTEHIKRSLIRATNWELHPVMKFEVCTLTKAKCDAGNGWHNLP
jgi:hypothetical protein